MLIEKSGRAFGRCISFFKTNQATSFFRNPVLFGPFRIGSVWYGPFWIGLVRTFDPQIRSWSVSSGSVQSVPDWLGPFRRGHGVGHQT
jgi:hypothetical protein